MKSNHESRITNHSGDKVAALPPVSEMMRAAGLEPKKQLGQNFLFDLNLTGKIARSVPDIENSVVVEVGPGPGGLTRALLAAGAKKVIAIEKDKSAAPILEQIAAAADGRLEIIFGDALKTGNDELGIKNYAICANLPYNIGTELLIRWLHVMAKPAPAITSMTLMFQKEVAMRIVARPGDPQYGRLSVLTSLVADAKILFNVPRTAFAPAPKVESAVVQILPKKMCHPGAPQANPGSGQLHKIENITNDGHSDSQKVDQVPDNFSQAKNFRDDTDISKIEQLTARLFGQRRKMIRGIMPGVDWAVFGLCGQERAEELSPEKFAEIAAKAVI
ncbi:MAG: 16S rRNA (adenine(1518)-N(6)/adenine(1519)-N(6))-dimethyltransferase RsmA [Rickettsiales bacterium]|jgi:16S rRNA (adenine1518-N6/adenine1519-N6)-dimethyltransferase|nr:16S rRNA (adenine(1518)-N(6)/adenine(1519)-N(6))-dimethyltransferase RsmA [Rickettsiales bacterium]